MDEIDEIRMRRDLLSGRAKAPALGDTVSALAEAMSGAIERLAKRVAELERQTAGMQKTVDHLDDHALIFAGAWLPETTYAAAAVVRHNGKAYTALRTIVPGKGEPGRSGAGWTEIV